MSDQTPTPLRPPEAPKAPPRRRRRPLALRILLWTGVGLVSIVALLVLVLFLPFTRQFIFDYARGILADAGVQSSSFSGSWDSMVLKDVAIVDKNGAWLTADQITIDWSPLGLLSRQIYANHIDVKGGHVFRTPVSEKAPDQKDEPFAWPDLPVSVSVSSLTADITLDKPVIGEAIKATVDGNADLSSSGASGSVTLHRTDGIKGDAAITASTDNKFKDVSVKLNAQDQVLAAQMAGDARLENLNVSLQAARDGDTCSGSATIAARDGDLGTLAVNPNCAFVVGLTDVTKLLPANTGLSGPATVAVQLVDDGDDTTTQVQLTADASKIVSTDPMFARLLPQAAVSGLVTVVVGGVKVDNLNAKLANGTIALTGHAYKIGPAINAVADFSASDLSVIRPDLKGATQAHLVYDTTSLTPIQLAVTGTNIASGQIAFTSLNATGAINAAGTGTVALKADGKAPIDITANITNALAGSPAVDLNGVIVGAKLAVKAATLADGSYDVSGNIDTDRLDQLGALAGIDLSGALKADFAGQVGGKAQTVKLNAAAHDVRYGAIEVGDATVKADASAQPDGKPQAVTLDATVHNLRSGNAEIGQVTVKADGPLNALNVDVAGTATLAQRNLTYHVAAAVADMASARVTTLKVSSPEGQVETVGAFTVGFAKDLTVQGLDARFSRGGKAAGEIVADASKAADGIKANAKIMAVDLETVSSLTGGDTVSGRLDMTATLDGAAGRANINGTVANLVAPGAGGRVPPANITIKGDWSGGRFGLNAVARTQGIPDANVDVTFPLARAEGGGIPSPSPNASLNGHVKWAGRLGPIFTLLDIGGQEIDGDVNVNVTLGGTISKPDIQGGVTLANGTYLNDQLGTRLAALNVSATLTGNTVTVKGGATDGARGRMAIDATFDKNNVFGGSGGVTFTGMQLLAQDNLSARVDGSLKVAAGAGGIPGLAGELSIVDLHAGIPEGTPPDLIRADVIDPSKPPPPLPKTKTAIAATTTSPAPKHILGLDIVIHVVAPAAVEGRGLNSIWHGDLHVAGDAGQPILTGEIDLDRGTLDFGSKTLTLTEGKISFDGGPTIDPDIHLVVTTDDSDYTYKLGIDGRPESLQITATSTPGLPQDEVFARILFGRSVTSISPLEALELANSIAALSGKEGSGSGVLGGLKSKLGLDVLSVGGLGGPGGAEVHAGKYLAKNVYFEVVQGGPNGSTSGRVELQITKHLSVNTEVGANSSGSIGGAYKIDY